MIDWGWINSTGTNSLMVFLSGLGIYIALMFMTRVAGLRSFSKMSSFDFATTVAIGSVVASTVLTNNPPLIDGVIGLLTIYFVQYVVSKSRRVTEMMEHLVDNEPLLLMAGDVLLEDNLKSARVTDHDLKSKLRQAGVTHPNQVMAVVFETTGDVSVLMKNDAFDPWLLKGVRGAERLAGVSRE